MGKEEKTIKMKFVYFSVILLFTVNCSKVKDENTVKDFFRKNQIGSAQDVGMYNRSIFDDSKSSLILTVHGMEDDMKFCLALVKDMNIYDEDNFPFFCSYLN